MSQHINVIGQVATAPKLFTPDGGVQFCTFRLACTERRFDAQKSEWVDGDTNWFTINIFRTLALHANESFAKGDRIIVSGRLRVRNWEKDEKRGTSVEIDVDGIGHDVRWGVSTFSKRLGSTASNEEASSNGEPPSTGLTGGQATGVWADPSEPVTEVSDALAETSESLSSDGFTPEVAAA